MKRASIRDGALAGLLLTLPLTALLYLISQLTTLPYLPYKLCIWLVETLPSTLSTSGFALTIAGLLYFDVDVDIHLVTMGQVISVVLFLGIGAVLALLTFAFMHRSHSRPEYLSGLITGMGFSLTLWVYNTPSILTDGTILLSLLLSFISFLIWGILLTQIYHRIYPLSNTAQQLGDVIILNRRQVLTSLGGAATLFTLLAGGSGAWLSRIRHSRKMDAMKEAFHNPSRFPTVLKARIYPSQPQAQFAELQYGRYHPDAHPLGVAISGGGPRSYAAAIGQIRGLQALGLLERVGAISAVSGGAWFSTLFDYAPTDMDDATLLGPILQPQQITLENLAEIPPKSLAAPLPLLTNNRIFSTKNELMLSISLSGEERFNRIYARLLNELFLQPFGLDNPHKFFTLNDASLNQILAQNPKLSADNFYTLRPHRPYLIVNATQIYPIGEEQALRHFEFTPLYSGVPQFFANAGYNGLDIGGGYVESFAFDSAQPTIVDINSLVSITTPDPIFLLADMLACTSAAPGVILTSLEKPEWFPRFMHWPLEKIGEQDDHTYSFVDGNALENLGIVPLLRRQYPIILVFANLQQPIGATNSLTVDGIDRHISRLFGFKPANVELNDQGTQIFPSEKFAALADGLKAVKANGKPTIFVDSYPIVQPNAFDIPSYPDGGEVTVIWCYNDINPEWRSRLTAPVLELLHSTDPTNFMANFPNYQTVNQNSNIAGLPQLLWLTPQQINLLGHMWTHTVTENVGKILEGLT